MLTKPLSWFKPDPNQPRKSFSELELRSLGESMKALGQLQPVGAKPDGTILWGERRFRAAQWAAISELSVIITDKHLTDTEIRIIQLSENLQHSQLSGAEQWLTCTELKAMNPNWMAKDLAEHLSLDPSMVTRLLSPSKCVVSVQEALKAGKIGISDCYAISKLPEYEQAELLALKLQGSSRDQLERAARKKRNDTPAVKVSSIKCPLPSGAIVHISGSLMGLDEIVVALTDALKAAKRATEEGFDAKTFQCMMRDKAKAHKA